ncbi:MAG: hypothetical protein U0031_02010 [Thermomicrobiales bacterium]
MDDRRFDLLTRTLATTAPRRVFTAMLTASLVAAMPGVRGEDGFAKKRKKKKKKKPPTTCIPACPSGKICQNNQCVDGCRDEDCFGSRRCRNGVCACPEGLQDCDGQFWCGECCSDSECPGFPNPNSLKCANEEAGSDVLICRCLSGVHCGDGRCVQCCNSDFCVNEYGPGKFCNANGGCACPEGTQQCAKEQGCRDTKSDRFACGPNCAVCGAGLLCENSRCCVGLANPCVFSDDCCSGLACVNIGTVFEPNFVCGTVP